MRHKVSDLGFFQDVIGVSDEEVAARAKWSTRTFQKAKRGQVPNETKEAFIEALESLRLEKLERLANLKCRTG